MSHYYFIFPLCLSSKRGIKPIPPPMLAAHPPCTQPAELSRAYAGARSSRQTWPLCPHGGEWPNRPTSNLVLSVLPFTFRDRASSGTEALVPSPSLCSWDPRLLCLGRSQPQEDVSLATSFSHKVLEQPNENPWETQINEQESPRSTAP